MDTSGTKLNGLRETFFVKTKIPSLYMDNREQKLLKEKSESTYAAIDIQNPRRVIRALTLLDHGKERADILKENDGKPLYPVEFLKVKIDKELGNKKIDDRIDKMFEEGFVSEVESLLKKYPSTIIGDFRHET